MKLTVLLTVVIICCQAVFAANGQKISLSLKNVPIEKAFDEIKKQSGYIFWYESNLLADAPPVTLVLTDASLDQALDGCFKNQPLKYQVVGQTIVVTRKQKP